MNTCCATNSLSIFVPDINQPWNKMKVKHLYNRTGFGASTSIIRQGLAMSPSDLVDYIIDVAINTDLPPEPNWINWDYDQHLIANQCYDGDFKNGVRDIFIAGEWLRSISDENNSFRFKMALFWHNHFVTEQNKYINIVFMYEYYQKLLQYSLGNFKHFVRAIVTDKAMLVYLDGRDNKVCSPNDLPNENLARELYELFTLGTGNYTDTGTPNDVYETARALSGWDIPQIQLTSGFYADDPMAPAFFDPSCHDSGNKTIFEIAGNFDTDGVIDNLFEQKQTEIADFICRKIYAEFIHPVEVNETVIETMKSTFISNNFEIEPVLRQLLKSEFFFDICFIASKVKSPAAYFIGFFKDADIPLRSSPFGSTSTQLQTAPPPVNTGNLGGVNLGVNQTITCSLQHVFQFYSNNLLGTWAGQLNEILKENGQDIFNPPNVGGWVGYHSWLSPTQLIFRWNTISDWLNNKLTDDQKINLVNYIKGISNNSVDNYEIAEKVLNHFIQRPEAYFYDGEGTSSLDNSNDLEVRTAAIVFAGSFPQEEFDLGYWNWTYANVFNQVKDLILHIIKLPEYQLY